MEVLSLRGHKRSCLSGHPPGPLGLGVCNSDEKQKLSPLTINGRSLTHFGPKFNAFRAFW